MIDNSRGCDGSNWPGTRADPSVEASNARQVEVIRAKAGAKATNISIVRFVGKEKCFVLQEQHTCAISSKQLKMYLRASLDLIPVSPSWSSGVCGRQEADVPLKSHHTSPLETHYLHLAHYSLLLLMCSRTRLALRATLG